MNKSKDQKFDLFAVMVLLLAFAIAILSLLLTGAGTYKSLTARDASSQELQVDSLYISNRIFQAPSAGSISVANYSGTSCLEIRQSDGGDYITRVYCYEGWIMELYSEEDYEFALGDGEQIQQAEVLEFKEEGGLLTVELKTSELQTTLYFALKGGSL